MSTRKVEALEQALGIAGISTSEVRRLAASLDDQVAAFRTRRLAAGYPYLWVDARYEHVRETGRVVSMAVVVAHGARTDGVREVLGLDVGLSEAVALLEAAEEEILTCYDVPLEHRRQIYSTNPLERLHKELQRRGAVVGSFPHRAAVIRLLGALLAEQNDEWLVGRHYFSETSMHKLLHPPPGTPAPMPLASAAS